MLEALKLPHLRKKILFSLGILVVFRFLSFIPVPGMNIAAIRSFVQGNSLLGLIDIFSGGSFANFSIVTLGLGPYITASIIVQLFTTMVPKLEELSKEGEQGREQINQYTKYLTLPIGLFQSYGVYFFLKSQGIILPLNVLSLITLMLTLLAGSMVLVWVGDLITEYGVGNGISILIFAGIISSLPASLAQFISTYQSYDISTLFLYAVLTFGIIISVVMINEGTRNITLQYGRRSSFSSAVTNYLPIKINQAGVIPIIFAVAVVVVPSAISGPLLASDTSWVSDIGVFLSRNFSITSFGYNALFFSLVVAFTFFYTSFQFDPEKISDDIKRRGGFIPGIRPGKATTEYLGRIITRLTMFGAVFLGLIAIFPYILQITFGLSNLAIGGTSLLIVVSVVLETLRQIKSQTVTNSYSGYLD